MRSVYLDNAATSWPKPPAVAAAMPGVTLQGTRNPRCQVACLSLTIAGLSPSDAGAMLDEAFDIQTRVGLHCAPAAHRTIGTYPTGTIRLAPGSFTSHEDMRYAVESIRVLARRR